MSIVFGVCNACEPRSLVKKTKKDQTNTIFISEKLSQSYYFQATHLYKQINSLLWHDNISKNAIIADANIFNRKDLQSKLNYPVIDISDAELILRAYNVWGIHCVQHLVGDFAFAIWDERLQQLFLARDPLGQKSLFYYYDANETFYFANIVKPLVAYSGIKKKFNEEKIIDFYTALSNDGESTFFQGIKKVPTAHFIIFAKKQKELTIKRYWSAANIHEDKLVLKNAEEYQEAFLDIYHKAIIERIPSFETSAFELSGGLDSSSVTCVAAKLAQQQNYTIQAFGYRSTPGLVKQPMKIWNYDDNYYMHLVCQQYNNVNLHYIYDGHKRLFEHHNELNSWLDEPPCNTINILWAKEIYEKAKELQIQTILAGDFTISWAGNLNNHHSLLQKIKRPLSFVKRFILNRSLGSAFNNPWADYCAIHPEFAKKYNLSERYHKDLLPLRKKINDYRIFSMDHFDLDYSAALAALFHYQYNIDWFDPTSDRRVVEFCLRIPNELFHNNNGSRMLIRNSMKGIMPKEICERTSRGMQSADWYKKIDREKNEINTILHRWQNTDINNYIDVQYLIKNFKHWDVEKIAQSKGMQYVKYLRLFNFKLIQALNLGLFLEYHNNNHE